MDNCSFYANSALFGGALYLLSGQSEDQDDGDDRDDGDEQDGDGDQDNVNTDGAGIVTVARCNEIMVVAMK